MVKVASAHRSKAARRRKRVTRFASPPIGQTMDRVLPVEAGRNSIEDPLQDWPDDEIDADRWLLERTAGDMQRDEG